MTWKGISRSLTAILLLCGLYSAAQPEINFEALQKKYPNNKVLVLADEEHFSLSVKNDKLLMQNSTLQQLLYLDDKVSGYSERSMMYDDDVNEITKLEACTWVYDGRKYKKIDVTEFRDKAKMSNDVFYDGTKAREFILPSIEKRAITEVKCTYLYKNPFFLGSYHFKFNSPVLRSQFTVTVPADIHINYIMRGDTSGVKFTMTEKKNMRTYSWTAENTDELRTYDDGPSSRYYAPHVFIYIEQYKTSSGVQKVSGDLKSLYNFNHSFLGSLNTDAPDPQLKLLVDSLKAISKDENDLIRNVYYWAQNNVKYIAFEDGIGGHKPREANDIYNKRYGDCKDFSSIITRMLQLAGVKSYLCWIGTRSIPYTFSEVPLPSSANHMIAAVCQNNQWIFLDGTAGYLRYKTPSGFIQGKECMISITPDSFLIVKVPVVNSNENSSYDSIFLSIDNRMLKGQAVLRLDGYSKYYLVSQFSNVSATRLEEEFKSLLSKGNNKCKVTDYTPLYLDNRDTLLLLKYAFEIDDYVRQIDRDLFINMNLSRTYQKEKTDTAYNRSCLREYKYAYSDEGVTVLQIPEGYKVKKLPKSISYKGGKFNFSYRYEQSGNTIIYRDDFRFNDLTLMPEEFAEWNAEIEKIIESYKDLVVLTQK